jgi:hypothetical protein
VDWARQGIAPGAVGTGRPELPASADLRAVSAIGAGSGLLIQVVSRDSAPQSEVAYLLRLDGDGSGANWLSFSVNPGGSVRVRDWRGIPRGTTPPLVPFSASLYEIERGAGPTGSLHVYLDLANLTNQLPARIRAQSYRAGSSEVFEQLPWANVLSR